MQSLRHTCPLTACGNLKGFRSRGPCGNKNGYFRKAPDFTGTETCPPAIRSPLYQDVDVDRSALQFSFHLLAMLIAII